MLGGQASAAITSGQPKEVGSRTQDGLTMLASTGPLLDLVCVCAQGSGALGTGGVDLERDTSRASSSNSSNSSNSSSNSSSNKCQPRNYCIIGIGIMLGSNEMMWRRIVDWIMWTMSIM